jgi:CBS domain containing-hemolysin-like protein
MASLAFSAFFSGMEIAFVSANKLEIELDKKLGYFAANIYSYFSKHQGFFITTMLVGNNIALVIYGMTAAHLLEKPLGVLGNNATLIFLLQTFISTFIVLIAGEFFPKVLFRIHPNKTLKIFAIPTVIICFILIPIVGVALAFTYLALWMLTGKKGIRQELVFSKIDLDHYIKEATAKSEKNSSMGQDVQIFQNALYFSEVKVRDCMVPRTEIVGLDIGESIEKLQLAFTETGLSKILIYKGQLDELQGYVHSFALFKSPARIKDVLMPISLVPEAMPAQAALAQLNSEKRSILGVIDEFGSISGIVTVEDIVEEIVGDIEDEHDKESYVEEQLGNDAWLLSARLEIDYLNQTFNLNLPESDEYDTLGGLIIFIHGSIPEEGTLIPSEHFDFEIMQASESRIEVVKVKKSR